jgi:hypothetical protein
MRYGYMILILLLQSTNCRANFGDWFNNTFIAPVKRVFTPPPVPTIPSAKQINTAIETTVEKKIITQAPQAKPYAHPIIKMAEKMALGTATPQTHKTTSSEKITALSASLRSGGAEIITARTELAIIPIKLISSITTIKGEIEKITAQMLTVKAQQATVRQERHDIKNQFIPLKVKNNLLNGLTALDTSFTTLLGTLTSLQKEGRILVQTTMPQKIELIKQDVAALATQAPHAQSSLDSLANSLDALNAILGPWSSAIDPFIPQFSGAALHTNSTQAHTDVATPLLLASNSDALPATPSVKAQRTSTPISIPALRPLGPKPQEGFALKIWENRQELQASLADIKTYHEKLLGNKETIQEHAINESKHFIERSINPRLHDALAKKDQVAQIESALRSVQTHVPAGAPSQATSLLQNTIQKIEPAKQALETIITTLQTTRGTLQTIIDVFSPTVENLTPPAPVYGQIDQARYHLVVASNALAEFQD